MRSKVKLDTLTDINEFVSITTKCDGKITVSDNAGHCVNAKSVLGMLYSMEFEELWCESENDIYRLIKKYIVE